MNQIFHILRYKSIAFIRLNSKVDFRALLKNLGSGSIYVGFAVGAFLFSLRMIHFLLVEAKVGLFLLHEFISMVLFIFFLSVNVGNIIVSYSTLYKSGEVNFLFTKPVDPAKIFLLKFLDNFFYSSSTMLMVMFSVLAGYTYYFRLTLYKFISLVLFNVVPFILSAGSLGVILLLLVIKLASKYGVKKIIYSLVGSYVIVIFLFFKINSPVKLVDVVMKYYPFLDKNQYLGDLIPSVLKLLPNHWLSDAAYWSVQNRPYAAINSTILQIALAVILFSTALYLGRRWYFETWLLNLKITAGYIASQNNKTKLFTFEKNNFTKPQSESIIKKDILVFMREPSQVIHISILIFLIIIFVASVSGIRYFRFGDHVLITIIYLSIYLFNLLLISTLSLRFIFPILSLEGLPFWKLKSAPVKIKTYIFKKLIPLGLLIFIIGQSLSFFVNIRFGISMILVSSLITAFATSAIIAINFGMGAIFVNYKEKNPIRISSSQGASISFLISICFMVFVIALLFLPLLNLFFRMRAQYQYNYRILFTAIIPVAGISIGVVLFFIRSVFKSLKKDF